MPHSPASSARSLGVPSRTTPRTHEPLDSTTSLPDAASASHHEPLIEHVYDDKAVQQQCLCATSATGERLFHPSTSRRSQLSRPAPAPAGSTPPAARGFCGRWVRVRGTDASHAGASLSADLSCDVGSTSRVASLVSLLGTARTLAPNATGVDMAATTSVFGGSSTSAAFSHTAEAASDFMWLDLHGVPPQTTSPQQPQLSTLHALWQQIGLSERDVQQLEAVAARHHAAGDGEQSVLFSADSTPESDSLEVLASAAKSADTPTSADRSDGSTASVEVHGPDLRALALADLYYEDLDDLTEVDVLHISRHPQPPAAAVTQALHADHEKHQDSHYAMLQLATLLSSVSPHVAQRLTHLRGRVGVGVLGGEAEMGTSAAGVSLSAIDRWFTASRKTPLMASAVRPGGGQGNGLTPIVGLYVICFPNLCVTWCPSSTLSLATDARSDATPPQAGTHLVQGWEQLQQAVFTRIAGSSAGVSAGTSAATLAAARREPLCTATFLAMLLTTVCSAYLPDTAAILSEVDAIDAMMPLIRPDEESDQADALRRVVLLRRKLSVHRRLLYQKVRLLETMQRMEVAVCTPFVLRPAAAWQTRAPLAPSLTRIWAVSALSPQLAPATHDMCLYRPLYDTVRGVQQRLDAARVILSHTTIIYTSSVTVRNSVESTHTDYFQLKIGIILLCVLPMNLVASHWGMNCVVPWQTEVVTDSLVPFGGIVGIMALCIALSLVYPMWYFVKGRPDLIATV